MNVIWTVFANKKLDFNDKRAQKFLNNLNLMFRQGSPNGGSYLLNIFPPFRYFSPKFKFTQKVVKEIQEYMRVSSLYTKLEQIFILLFLFLTYNTFIKH